VTRDDLFKGPGDEIVRSAYRVFSGIQHLPPGRQVQAVTLVFATLVDILGIRPWELIDSIKRVVDDEAGYATTKALQAYVEEELKRGHR